MSCSGAMYAGVPSTSMFHEPGSTSSLSTDVLGHEAEIEHDDAAVGRDEHVRRFDVAMHDAEAVDGVERGDQLRDRGAKARLVEHAIDAGDGHPESVRGTGRA